MTSVSGELIKEWTRVGTQTMMIGDALENCTGPLSGEEINNWTSLISFIDKERSELIVKTHEYLTGGR